MKILMLTLGTMVMVSLAIYQFPDVMINPGPLAKGHEGISSDCSVCHTGFLGVKGEKCVSCHKIPDIGIKRTTGEPIVTENPFPHGHLTADTCLSCHTDHKGADSIVFTRFSHELLPEGAKEDCKACHQRPTDSIHSALQDNCIDCHGTTEWKPAQFDHTASFRFDRHHPNRCRDCHQTGNYSEYTCYGCHEHSQTKIAGEHREEGIRDYENCVECHRSSAEGEAERLWGSSSTGGTYAADDEDYYEGEYYDD